ncbi:Ribosomal RNA-processing protein 8 [Phytophthora cinnamomi]|uniref:Ribosomal RNA-processing protein 8 n=1 Tax=Phytophthora cinnamomi TaxID=4785 RepID=UPI003559DD90|nr:Ribosomal RNA-processing protein 8 [Phytophthora cinnamomi]
MTCSASRQKANNAKNGTAAPPVNAQVKPASAMVVKRAQMTGTPTRVVQSTGNIIIKSPSANANASGSINVNVIKTAEAKNSKSFTLSDVTTWSVQRARQIRKTDFERFAKLHNYFTAKDDAVARPINSRANFKREHVDQWVGSVLSPKTLACIQSTQETQQALLSLIIVSAALTKYGEQELVRKYSFGEMDSVIGARFGTKGLQSKKQVKHSVGASFVLRLALGLAPGKRAACQVLREILSLDSKACLVLVPTSKGLKQVTGRPIVADWTKVNQYKLKHMVKQAQSDKFQEAMMQLGGLHLYEAIRTQLQQIGGAWDASKDQPALQEKNVGSRSNSAKKNTKPQKETELHMEQQANNSTRTFARIKGQIQTVKKNVPLEAAKWTQIPPPVPVSVKPIKDTAPTNAHAKNAISANSPTQNKNATLVRSAPLIGAWAGPLPASVVLSRPNAIVSNSPAMAARGGNGGRAIISGKSS